jgi:hypothetical protein
MKHPVRSDFDTAVTEAGVTVTFKPTNSIYSFYRLAESEDGLGPVSLERVRHAGPSGDTEDYPSDEVQDMAQRVPTDHRWQQSDFSDLAVLNGPNAAEVAATVSGKRLAPGYQRPSVGSCGPSKVTPFDRNQRQHRSGLEVEEASTL